MTNCRRLPAKLMYRGLELSLESEHPLNEVMVRSNVDESIRDLSMHRILGLPLQPQHSSLFMRRFYSPAFNTFAFWLFQKCKTYGLAATR